MLADLVLAALVRAQAAGSFGVLVVLLLRDQLRSLFGAEVAHRLWLLPPAMALVGLFPTLSEFFGPPAEVGATVALPHASGLLAIWATGAVVAALVVVGREVAFRRMADLGEAGPAVMGVLWPRLVIPSDFEQRFSADERAVIRRHEAAHIALGHPRLNLLIAAFQALSWFNPIVHVAAAAARLDQELACDAAVVGADPAIRRLYGETLVRAHLATPRSPLSCAFAALGRHPLETRLAALTRRQVSLATYLRGAATIAAVAAVAAALIWAYGPRWDAAPRFVWQGTPAAGLN